MSNWMREPDASQIINGTYTDPITGKIFLVERSSKYCPKCENIHRFKHSKCNYGRLALAKTRRMDLGERMESAKRKAKHLKDLIPLLEALGLQVIADRYNENRAVIVSIREY
jgi:hypothetical protein